MRKLNIDNPKIAKPENVASFGAILPLIMGLYSMVLVADVVPEKRFLESYSSKLFFAMSIFSLVMIFMPKLLKLGWETKYFGIASFYVGSVSLFGLSPLLCIFLYSGLSVAARLLLVSINIILIFFWCRRFVVVYREIFLREELRNKIYVEDAESFYYIQKADSVLIRDLFKLRQSPHYCYFFMSIFAGVISIFFSKNMINFFGVPFPHIFFSIINIPLTLMSLGFATRGWLIFYYYPWKIYSLTGKKVLVDMTAR